MWRVSSCVLTSPAPAPSVSSSLFLFPVWSSDQSVSVFAHLDSTMDALFSSLAREQERRHLLELSSQQAGGSASSAAEPKAFGYMNIKHLRMMNQQNQLIDQHMRQADEQTQAEADADADADDAEEDDADRPESQHSNDSRE